MDIILTQYGRKKLSQGDLQIKYYRFFDDEVNYQTQASELFTASVVAEPTGSVDPVLLYLASGTFTRTTSGSYYNGSTSSIAWAAPDVLRYEDRGDGNGALALLEGSRTNIFQNTQWFDAGSWLKTQTNVITDVAVSPDGTTTADLAEPTTTVGRFVDSIPEATIGNDVTGSVSFFLRSPDGSGSLPYNIRTVDRAGTITSHPLTASEVWNRYSVVWSTNSGSTSVSAGAGTNDTGQQNNMLVWGAQWEAGAFPTSYIVNSGSSQTATRGTDILSFPTASHQSAIDEIATTGVEFDFFPLYSSDEISSLTASPIFFNWLGSNYFALLTTKTLRAVEGGVSRISTAALTWGREQKITIRVQPTSGTITVSGTTTGNGTYAGTAFSWPTGSMNVSPSTNPIFGRISDLRRIT